MEGLQEHVRYVMLGEQLRKFVVFIVKVSRHSIQFENGFQSFVLVIRHWEMNLDQDVHQNSIKML